MSELNVTALVASMNDPADYSASRAELGEHAGRITWGNATRDARELFGDAFNREAFDDYFRGFGAWDTEELAAHSDDECAALMLQFIAGDIREVPSEHEPFTDEWWLDYEDMAREGVVAGRLARGIEPGTVFYYIGD